MNVFFLNFSRSSRARAGPTLSSRARAGPIWAHISDFWFNFVCFGVKIEFLMKFLNDSAWFCVEKLKKHGFDTKKPRNKTNNLKIEPTIQQITLKIHWKFMIGLVLALCGASLLKVPNLFYTASEVRLRRPMWATRGLCTCW